LADLFADTYALLAHFDGAPSFRPHFAKGGVVTTALNAVEFAHGLLLRGLDDDVDRLLRPVLDIVVEPPHVAVAEAARFKRARREAGARCSYVDAWGYATARALDVPFLTGDEDFRGVPGVKFVKAAP
jgi:predicted nucleic acid-binding protein